MGIALRNEIPTYADGLGVLAGDTVRSAVDLAFAWFPVNNATRVWVLDLWEHGFNGHTRHLERAHASLHACACPPASGACSAQARGGSDARAWEAQA